MGERALRLARWAVLSISGVTVGAFIAEFTVEVARENGLFDQPTSHLLTLLNFLSKLPDTLHLFEVFLFSSGLGLGLWLPRLVKTMSTKEEEPDWADLVRRTGYILSDIALIQRSQTFRVPEIEELVGKLYALCLSYRKLGFVTPVIDAGDTRNIIIANERFYSAIKPLIADGHIEEAKEKSVALSKTLEDRYGSQDE